jgi:MFS transporter, PAT family, beta-lactamase induction signal transducer AmpG
MFFSYNLAVGLMGFMSGMALLLSAGTLNFWLTSVGIDKTSIGIFSLISIPYAISFIWSPIFDHLRIPFLSKLFGLRFSWIIVLQMLLSIAVGYIGTLNPHDNLMDFALIGLVIAFLSSSQDVALGALRAELVPRDIQASTTGTYIFGYRMGMLLASSGAIYASIYLSWLEIYRLFGNIILYFPIVLYFITYNVPRTINEEGKEKIFKYLSLSFWREALKSLGSKGLVSSILIFLILYRIPDNFISVMINPFLVETGFDAFQIATVGKFLGIITAIIGGLIAGQSMKKMKILDAMLIFGIIHSMAHLLFILQNEMGSNIYILFLVVGVESTTGGMVMAAYIAFITSLCRGKYSATQYAFLSSMMGISGSIFPSMSGIFASEFGWNSFFLFITILTIPPLIMSFSLRKKLEAI